jgi:hypothetical protein
MCKYSSYFVGLLALIMNSTVTATEPGTLMNCSDLILEPGLSCTKVTAPGANAGFSGSIYLLDNEGQLLRRGDGSTDNYIQELGTCGQFTIVEAALVYRVDQITGVDTPIISTRLRCLDPANSTIEQISVSDLLFDSVKGTLIVGFSSGCGNGTNVDSCPYSGSAWIAHISGFTPLKPLLRKPSKKKSP